MVQMQGREYAAILPIPVPGLSIGVGILLAQDAIAELDFLWQDWCEQAPRSALAKRTVSALKEYFHAPTARLTLPLRSAGTEFQKKVWQEMRQIPVGQTRSYGVLAQRLRSSARAVGNACRANPLPIIVPCHRVVAANGEIGGFAGHREGPQLALKRWLLAHEQNC
jgi:methylated-DNA-[protein]-cysteine S-methyltransferase